MEAVVYNPFLLAVIFLIHNVFHIDDTFKQNISMHTANVLQEKELDEKPVVKDYLTTASDGKNYNVTYYALPIFILKYF